MKNGEFPAIAERIEIAANLWVDGVKVRLLNICSAVDVFIRCFRIKNETWARLYGKEIIRVVADLALSRSDLDHGMNQPLGTLNLSQQAPAVAERL
jgi:hypothetical protein